MPAWVACRDHSPPSASLTDPLCLHPSWVESINNNTPHCRSLSLHTAGFLANSCLVASYDLDRQGQLLLAFPLTQTGTKLALPHPITRETILLYKISGPDYRFTSTERSCYILWRDMPPLSLLGRQAAVRPHRSHNTWTKLDGQEVKSHYIHLHPFPKLPFMASHPASACSCNYKCLLSFQACSLIAAPHLHHKCQSY